jgi:hypothetical protein
MPLLLDSIVQATGSERGFVGFPVGTKAIQYYPRLPGDTTGPHAGDPFFDTFGRSSRASICSCETKPEPTLSQALHLMAGDTVQGRISSGAIGGMLAANRTPESIIDELYIRALSRRPTQEEMSGMMALVGKDVKNRRVYEDIFWSLLNSTEFTFNH